MSDLSQRSGSPYWLMVRNSARRRKELEVFSLDLGRVRLLPLFHSEESAERFRRHVPAGIPEQIVTGPNADGEWQTRATGAGELISLLSGSAFDAGPCAGVERVMLDPSPEIMDRIGDADGGKTDESFGGESRGRFLERLMGRGRPWFETRDRTSGK